MGLWCEVAWIKLGDVELPSGRRTLQIRPLPLVKEEKKQQPGPDGRASRSSPWQRSRRMSARLQLLVPVSRPLPPQRQPKTNVDWQTGTTARPPPSCGICSRAVGPGRAEFKRCWAWQVSTQDEQEVNHHRADQGPAQQPTARWMSITYWQQLEVKPLICHGDISTQVNVLPQACRNNTSQLPQGGLITQSTHKTTHLGSTG